MQVGADLTCPVSFGHQPCEAATDFGSGEVVVLERLYCWSNKRLLGVPGILNFTHISNPSTVMLSTLYTVAQQENIIGELTVVLSEPSRSFFQL